MSRFRDRLIRAARLDPQLYEEVEADRSATGQAVAVVVLSSVAAGIGAPASGGPGGLVGGVAAALAAWALWALLTLLVGTRILPEPQTHADLGELLRTIGFASAPGLVRIVGIVPGLAGPVDVAATVWTMAAVVVAVRQALDYRSTPRAVGVCLIAWLAHAMLVAFLFGLFGGAPGT
ncbi:MAG: hypothetical protein Kow0092_25140 [Deferrisomatales bacterium]